MTEQAWSDERIQQRYDELNAIAPGYPDLNMRDVAREIRDDLQQRIEALEAECERMRRKELPGSDGDDSMAQYRGILPYDPDGPSSEKRVRRGRDGDEQDMMARRIDRLAKRVAMLEHEQRKREGKLPMSVPRFWRQGSTIIDRENGWNEIGTYQDIAAEVLELRAENARLRAILSDEDVIEAIRTVCRNLADRDANDEWLPERDAIHVWLQSLESEGAE